MKCIPTIPCTTIDKFRFLLVPLFYVFSIFCSIWHFLYEVKSVDNILDLSINTNFLVGGVQVLWTNAVVNIGLKQNHLKVRRYFENIVESSEEFISKAREEHLSKNLQIANTVARFFYIFFMVNCHMFPIFGLVQTNYVSPNFYRFPGIPPTSVFFYPVNIIGQFLIYFIAVSLYIIMDCLFFIYMFYFRGEIQSITAVVKLLSQKENVTVNCDQILRSIYRAHRDLLNEFNSFSRVLWHFYCHKLLSVILLTCSSFFAYSKTTSLVTGLVMQMLMISLLFLLCMPGQLLDNCSDNLQETLYESLWYEMQPKDQRKFLILYKASQRSIKAETMGIEKMSFSTLVQGMKTAISYAAFIYAVLLS
ncbi:Odorant receptor [Sergentomyia squamirostris]